MTSEPSPVFISSTSRTFEGTAPISDRRDQPDWLRLAALVFMHGGCLAVFWVGWSWTAFLLAVLLYLARAFGLPPSSFEGGALTTALPRAQWWRTRCLP